ncbi:tRNA (adenosine(37)-N6)-threonylcarbamoyltransferase complex ATPase subunit type 1 TsaE [Thiovibrio frasassiensis]|uniref:tRNA threonylcarbamoyladenosine biosynthesis protein TsaE n=1 Tax=Thiovibrio frasassiensis TaxID=2984131 RepID=A0A9X4MIF3_9BACT|nr:tRNA (adenosine(37)-N6)-threonylcarbamoyltransferase complex ATPase subunit type 1 TsaE [Thiovibrio frasassiensis]MDG4476128.1 tRNA (adenosine(37)-N6)-threonylcarbamoyltransferase complex ATPase subunit type 1 TsaE [Thiovibrio frasassiensis]
MTLTIPLPDLHTTLALGRYLGKVARPGEVITLGGSLGAGKTTLTQAIGQGLQVPEAYYITSPTFSLLHEYPGRLPLYHLDLYRLSDETEIEEIGLLEYLYGTGLTVIEWPDRLGSLMPEERLHIEITLLNETARLAEITGHGGGWREKIVALQDSKKWLSPSSEE